MSWSDSKEISFISFNYKEWPHAKLRGGGGNSGCNLESSPRSPTSRYITGLISLCRNSFVAPLYCAHSLRNGRREMSSLGTSRGKDLSIQKLQHVHYPFWFGGSASCFAAAVTHPLDLSMDFQRMLHGFSFANKIV